MATIIIHEAKKEHLDALLANYQWDPVGKMVRLALWAGLNRNEILSLTWEQVSPQGLALSARTIPLEGCLASYLRQCPGEKSGYVVVSPRTHRPLTGQGAGHSLRQAFDQVGEPELRLSDLRSHYIIRMLQSHTPGEVCRWSGVSLLTLKADFGAYLPSERPGEPGKKTFSRTDLEAFLQQKPTSVCVRAISLAWKEGMAVKTMASLTWEALSLPQKQRLGWSGETGLVLVGPRSGQGLSEQRISRIAAQALVDGGLDHVTLRDLMVDYRQQQEGEQGILDYFNHYHHGSTMQVSQHLGMEKASVFHQLKRLCQQGHIVQVGNLYYLPDFVVRPEAQFALVQHTLEEYGAVMRKDVVDLLKITPNQCSVLLKKWVNQGQLRQNGQIYYLA